MNKINSWKFKMIKIKYKKNKNKPKINKFLNLMKLVIRHVYN